MGGSVVCQQAWLAEVGRHVDVEERGVLGSSLSSWRGCPRGGTPLTCRRTFADAPPPRHPCTLEH